MYSLWNIITGIADTANIIVTENNQTKVQESLESTLGELTPLVICNHGQVAPALLVYTNYRNRLCASRRCIFGESLRVGIYGPRICVDPFYSLITNSDYNTMCPAGLVRSSSLPVPVCVSAIAFQPVFAFIPKC